MPELVSPSMHDPLGQMDQGKLGHMGMQQQLYWGPQDEKDAYIGWLKSEFAAANALIDSMCQHMHSLGDPGEYDMVFGCLNRRRHAWTPSLYMQHFNSVAEVVNALQEVAWKKIRGHNVSSIANAGPRDCSATQVQGGEAQDKANGSHVKATPETGEAETPYAPDNALSDSAKFRLTGCDNETSCIADAPSSTIQMGNNEEQTIGTNQRKGHANDQASLLNDNLGLDVKKLLNVELSIASKEEDARCAMIKRSMQFHCCEQEDGKMINDGESVELCESVFNSREVDEIIQIICQFEAAGRQGGLGCTFRGCKKPSRLPDIIQFGPTLGT